MVTKIKQSILQRVFKSCSLVILERFTGFALYYQPARFDPFCSFLGAKPWSLIFLSVPQNGLRLPTNESFNALVASESGVKRICRLAFAWNEGLAELQGKLKTMGVHAWDSKADTMDSSMMYPISIIKLSCQAFQARNSWPWWPSMSNLEIPRNTLSTLTKMRRKRTKHWPFPGFPGVLKEESLSAPLWQQCQSTAVTAKVWPTRV